MSPSTDMFINPHASAHLSASTPTTASDRETIKQFHHNLPDFNVTPLLNVPTLAQQLNVNRVLVKAESSRLGLPAFKILGASWGVYRSVCAFFELAPAPLVPLSDLGRKARDADMTLFAATDGNHGRAVARMARLLGVKCAIFAPKGMYPWTQQFIKDEGAEVVVVGGDYDAAVAECWRVCCDTKGGLMVQDNAFEGYGVVPGWISEGYGTMMAEVDEQFDEVLKDAKEDVDGKEITHVVTPIGVGSLGNAVVKWAKTISASRKRPLKVVAVEPETAACLNASLRAGRNTTIGTEDTIMSGMCCGTVSPIAWQALKEGVDVSVTVGDGECHEMVLEVVKVELRDEEQREVEVGPCGAGCLVGLKKVCGDEKVRKVLGLDGDSVVVVLSTEGKREYPVPERLGT
ncbi:hypothetical protein H2198_003481 [Neophaeococcomyces mojaviensis]|uniref:Uncharacterized protein n=1 Tax=Neophaeococcomyces mojaviensis TaxID=3383035 RepID=A0ACC3ABI5_9EURO|nr:hypothetical protein H2198_003481 [Knufia sp. JES_112]